MGDRPVGVEPTARLTFQDATLSDELRALARRLLHRKDAHDLIPMLLGDEVPDDTGRAEGMRG